MSLEVLQTMDVIEIMENYIESIRPPKETRDQIDYIYKIENQSIVIYEVRPYYLDDNLKIESGVAKTTFIKKTNKWNVFYLRSDLKWHVYGPKPSVNSLKEFVALVKEDKLYCFFG